MPQFTYAFIGIRELKYPQGWDILGRRKRDQKVSEIVVHFSEAVPESKVVDLANELARTLAGQPLAEWL